MQFNPSLFDQVEGKDGIDPQAGARSQCPKEAHHPDFLLFEEVDIMAVRPRYLLLGFDGYFPEIDGKEQGGDSQDEEKLLPGEEAQPKGDEYRDGKEGKTGSGLMKSKSLPPVSVIIGLSNNRDNRRKIGPSDNPQKKEENVESEIIPRPLNAKEYEECANKASHHQPLVSQDVCESPNDQNGQAVPNGERRKEPTRLPMRNGKIIFN
jgi:hypothetical protein